MRTATSSTIRSGQSELPGMLATLCSYENFFGPYHPQTLTFMTEVGIAYCRAGELACARPLLERAVRDLGRFLDADHDVRLRAIAALRNLFIAQRDYDSAGAAQRELLDCHVRRLGPDHSKTLAASARLEAILLQIAPSGKI